ncbi:hypothetical protein M9Y10_025057 [Tritrichomonas musculus]|uniref:Uncharacterized protein n=1 Tax=Tritrichomonas musculus TaxID=1915356 RepID=A0ABR2HAE6_9EUKA
MEHQIEKEDKATLTDFIFVDCYPQSGEEEAFVPRLDDGTIVSYESEDPFLRDYYNSYSKWANDGERFLNEEFVKEYISTGKITILRDGRPEMEAWLNYTCDSNAFLVEWGNSRVFAKEFIEKMLKVFNEHGNIPEYLSSKSQTVIQLSEWNPPD